METSTNFMNEDESCLQIEDLPGEMMVEIFSYFDTNEKRKISMVNRRWFAIANNEIEALLIKWPQESMAFWKFVNGQFLKKDVRNLILRP